MRTEARAEAKSAALEAVIQLVERFDCNREAYLSGKYNEAQLRGEFVLHCPERSAVSRRLIAFFELYGLTEEEIGIVEGGNR